MTAKKKTPKRAITAASHLKTWSADQKADIKRAKAMARRLD